MRFLADRSLFDKIWILPSFAHPFEKQLASFEDRLRLCALAFQKISPKVEIKSYEKEAGSLQGYTIDLICFLKKKFPGKIFFWVMGSDLFLERKKWKDFEKIEQLVQIYPIPRRGYEESIFPLISSSQIREAIQRKDPSAQRFLSSEVYQSIQEKKLYL